MAMLIGSTNASALELSHRSTISEADANYCGDLNEIATFDIATIDASDVYEWNKNKFALNESNFKVLASVIRKYLGAEHELIVTNRYEHALNHLVEDLSLDYDYNERPFLGSCHSLSILRDFGLRVSRSARRIQPIWETESFFTYLTISEKDEFTASEMKYNVAIDLEKKLILIYRIW